MKRIIPVFCLAVGCSLCSKAQLYIDNATFFIEPGATVTVQGDLTSNASIQGTGKILLKGTTLQSVNMNNGGAATNAYTIPNLEVDNTANVALTGNVRIGTSLTFTNGKIQAGNFNFTLANAAATTGMAVSKFVETNGTGMVQREIGNAAASNVLLPTGIGTAYAPVLLTHSGGTYSNAVLSAQAKAGKSPNAHIRTESYTNVYWPLSTIGVTGGTYTGTATYPADASAGFTGTETDIYGMSYSSGVWSRTGGNQNYTANTVTAQLASNTGQLLGMNRFVLLNSRVLLQGAYPGTGAVMNDGLRTSPSVIPTTEPYRSAPYSFTTVDGGIQEIATASVFADQASINDNIVDWMFVELRNNATSSSSLVQTRSVFVQRDGDVVDIDGASPVYFKNLDPNDFTVTLRHRNHLAISTNNAGGFFKSLALAPSSLLDFTSTSTNVLGTSGANYATVNGFNMMYSGNTNYNTGISYNGPSNDRAPILAALTALGLPQGGNIPNIYSPNDVNMNKTILYNGPNNDRSPILLNLGSLPSKSQVLPN